MSEEIFFSVLKEKFPALLTKICKKKYVLLVPLKKFITGTMLNQNFYDNHIFFISQCEPNIYINFNGKSLIYNEPDFRSYLGWKSKVIEFKFKEKVILDLGSQYGSLEYMSIDNVCDEVHFNSTVPSAGESKPTTVKQFTTSEEYIKYYNNFTQTNADYKEAEKKLTHFVNMMKNNYILMKDHEFFYYEVFKREIIGILEAFKAALGKVKVDETFLTIVVSELVESLVFSKYKLHDTIMESLRSFYDEEEKFIFQKLKEAKNEYSLSVVLGPQYKDCQFAQSIAKLKELSQQKTHFEKFRVIRDINSMITRTVKEAYYKATKTEKSMDADFYITFWIYLFSQANWTNLIAEINFLFNFIFFIGPMEGDTYLCTTTFGSLNKIQKDMYKNENRLSQNIQQSVITTKAINPLKTIDRE